MSRQVRRRDAQRTEPQDDEKHSGPPQVQQQQQVQQVQATHSIFSPHNSVFQALNNPELGNLSRVNSRNVCESPDLLSHQFKSNHQPETQASLMAMEHDQQQQQQYPQNEFASWHMVPQNSTSISSSNVSRPSSILSSSDVEDAATTTGGGHLESHYVINSYISNSQAQAHAHSQAHPLQQRTDAVIFFDNELPNSEDEDLKTELEQEDDEGSSTLHGGTEKLRMPSFIMPRVSMTEDDMTTAGGVVGGGAIDDDKLRVNIVGQGAFKLMNRLNSYGKILQNVKFNNVNPDIVVLIVDQTNMLLSQQMTKPFIPIFIMNADTNTNDIINSSANNSTNNIDEQSIAKLSSTANSFLSASRICQPIRLNSFEDDLFHLINVLSSIDIKKFHEKRVSNTSVLVRSTRPTTSSTIYPPSGSATTTSKKIKKKTGKDLKKKPSPSSNNNGRLISTILKFMTDNSGKLVLSIGYIGLCYYGVSFLMNKRQHGSATGTTAATNSMSPMMKDNSISMPISSSSPPLSSESSTTFTAMSQDFKNYTENLVEAMLTQMEKLIHNFVERGRLTSYWFCYNFLVMCE